MFGKVEVNTGKPFTAWKKADSERVGRLMQGTILSRVREGMGADSKPFRPYTTAYAKKKGVGRIEVDLRDTGKMLGQMRIYAEDLGVTVEAGADYAVFVDAIRPFMGFEEGDIDRIMELVEILFGMSIDDSNKGVPTGTPIVSGGR